MNNKTEKAFRKGWASVAEIDLSAIRYNLSQLRKMAGKPVHQMAVVKADAYGHGAVDVARAAEPVVDWLGVYQVREGARLRKKGIIKPILVFGTPTPDTASFYAKYDLTATISDLSQLDLLPDGTSFHFKFDTGMGRSGLMPDMADAARDAVQRFANLRYGGLMTHFASSEVPGSDIFAQQHDVFNQIVDSLGEGVLVHASNSGGVVHQSGAAYGMIRNGIAMYGFDPDGTYNPNFRPVLRWVSRTVQLRRLPAGSGVSYNHTWHMPDDGYLAIIPVGYADGFNRLLSNKISVEINGKEYPQVGNVTMDQIVIYLGQDKVEPGAPVMLMGGSGNCSAFRWAELLHSIPYEVTSRIGTRVKRVFIDR